MAATQKPDRGLRQTCVCVCAQQAVSSQEGELIKQKQVKCVELELPGW